MFARLASSSEERLLRSGTPMAFANHDVIEIEAAQYHAVARVRNVMGDRLHVAFEAGYVPWSDAPVLVRRHGQAMETAVDARIVHASGPTAMIELLDMSPNRGDRLAPMRDTMTDEA